MLGTLLVAMAAVGQTSVTISWGNGLGRGGQFTHTEVFNGTWALSGGEAIDMSKDCRPDPQFVPLPNGTIGTTYVSTRPGIKVAVKPEQGGGWTILLFARDNRVGWQHIGAVPLAVPALGVSKPLNRFMGDTGFVRVD